jgi:hypothetical protein
MGSSACKPTSAPELGTATHSALDPNTVCQAQTVQPCYTDSQSRTDKKQHFSEKVSKVESILAAAEGKSVEKRVLVTETVQKRDGNAAAAGAAAPPAAPKEQQEPRNPATHQGTWASMLRK